jgi:hypothetical protein
MSTRRHWRNRNVGAGCYGANAPGNRAPGYSLGQREVLPYDGRVKITMTVTLAPELTEAIKESADRHGVSFDLRRGRRPVRGPGRMTADKVHTSDPGDLRARCAATGFKAVVIDY